MTTVVISQPMLFPWPGMFEQIRQADVYVHLDDAQFSKGSFVNRVQLKCDRGSTWMTIPLEHHALSTEIRALRPAAARDWRGEHLALLESAYMDAPHVADMLRLVHGVYDVTHASLSDLLIAGIEMVCRFFGLDAGRRFVRSSELQIGGRSSARVLAMVQRFGGDRYVTGHGAAGYLDHELFEHNAIDVRYLDYQRRPYPQLHGAFNPHVTILDLIANCGVQGVQTLTSGTVAWRDFVAGRR